MFSADVVLKQIAKNSNEPNSNVQNYYQLGQSADDSVSAAAMAPLLLFGQVIREPCFDALRTKEQLGYAVSSGASLTHGVPAFVVVVQSASHVPSHLDARIEEFLAAFEATLTGLSPEQFERHRAAVVALRLQRDRTLSHEAERHWQVRNKRLRSAWPRGPA